MKRIKTTLVFMVALLVLAQAALAADTKSPSQPKPKYKKVTAEVVSVGPNSIVVKRKTKGNITLAVTDKTDTVGGRAPKAGDRTAVNYRVDKNGNTATRIEVLTASAKPSQAQAAHKPAPAPAAKSSK